MKKVMLGIAAATLMATSGHSQLKVNSLGNVSLGDLTPNDYAAATVQQRYDSYGYGGLSIRGINQQKSLYLGQYNANAHFGSNTDVIAFFHWYTSYNKVYAQSFNIGSDRKIKSNIESLDGGLAKVLELRSVSYNLKEDLENGIEKKVYGFISQEVQEILPEVTSEQMDILCLDYIQIIPFLVSGIQEQQTQIETQNELISEMQDELSELKSEIESLKSSTNGTSTPEKAAVLYQNKPNPFKERTTISFALPEKFMAAEIMIFDMKGTLLETYDVTNNTDGAITLEGRSFKPGMYMYSLIVDDVEVDTKRMILNK